MSGPGYDVFIVSLAAVFVAAAFVASTWVNAIGRLSKGRAERLAIDQPKPGGLLIRIAEDPSAFLTAALLLMLVMRITATVLVAGLLVRWGVALPELSAIVAMTFLLFQ
ncbi:MAG: hypothetical protein ACRDIA_06110, partial [Actinomycetota bacterium]